MSQPLTITRAPLIGLSLSGFVLGLSLLLTAGVAPASAQAQTSVHFSLDGPWEGPDAPFAVALDKGYFKAEGLDVTIETASQPIEPIAGMASGTFDAGLGDVNTLIRYRAEHPDADVQAVMIMADRPSFAIVGRKSRGITADLGSLRHRTIAALPTDAAYAQWPIIKVVNKVDDAGLTVENASLSGRESLLAQGKVDAVFGSSLSSVGLKSWGVPNDDIVVLLMSDYGLDLYGDAVMISPAFAAQKPEAVKALLRALTKAVQDTIRNPAFAVDGIVRRNSAMRKDVEMERLKMMIRQNILTPWVKSNGFGGIDKDRFARALDQIGLISSAGAAKTEPNDIFTDAYLPAMRKID